MRRASCGRLASGGGGRKIAVLTIACALSLAACNSFAGAAGGQSVAAVDIDPRRPGEARIGEVVFMAGYSLELGARSFGGLSGLAVAEDGSRMVAVTDHGHWVAAPLGHDASGRLTGIGAISMQPLIGVGGEAIDTILEPRERDAESLALLPDGRAVVTFERRHRIWVYDAPLSAHAPLELDAPETVARLPENAGLETVVALPDGRLLVLAEAPIGPGTTIDAWILDEEGRWRSFAYLMRDGYDATDAAALPDGRIVVLERWFAPPASLRIRLRLLTLDMVREGALVDGRRIAEFTQALLIDNFEGLAARAGPNGEVLLYMVSDDNFNDLQATYLYQLRLEP